MLRFESAELEKEVLSGGELHCGADRNICSDARRTYRDRIFVL